MEILIENNQPSLDIEKSVFQVLAYFDIFSFPLTFEEIKRYSDRKLSNEELQLSLNQLINENKINEKRGFYFLGSEKTNSVDKRLLEEEILLNEAKKIKRYAKLISKFPFVEAAFISGSVSKGILSRNGDVDYFIVAKANRVWLCRSILIAFKKIALFNSRKYFCVNYFIDTNNLLVPDKNLFVATEIASLQPIENGQESKQFFAANQWISDFFPNVVSQKPSLFKSKIKKGAISKMIERVCKNSLGEALDNFFFKITLNRWKNKFPEFNKGDFDLNMRSYKNVSKHHPRGYQKIVLDGLSLRMNKFEENN